jgi:hypothetical protein
MPFLFFKLRFGCHLTNERRVADLMNTRIDRCHGTSRRLVNCTCTSKEKELRQNGFRSLLSTRSRERCAFRGPTNDGILMAGGKRLTCFVNAPTRTHSLSDVRTERNNAALYTAAIAVASHSATEIE